MNVTFDISVGVLSKIIEVPSGTYYLWLQPPRFIAKSRYAIEKSTSPSELSSVMAYVACHNLALLLRLETVAGLSVSLSTTTIGASFKSSRLLNVIVIISPLLAL